MCVKPKGNEGIPPGNRESCPSGSSDSQLSGGLVNVGNSNESLTPNTKKEQNSSSLNVAKQSDAALLKEKREELVKEKEKLVKEKEKLVKEKEKLVKEKEKLVKDEEEVVKEWQLSQAKLKLSVEIADASFRKGEEAEHDDYVAFLNEGRRPLLEMIEQARAVIDEKLSKVNNKLSKVNNKFSKVNNKLLNIDDQLLKLGN